MSDWELKLGPVYDGVNKKTGRFMKGHVPANKGKKWDEYMSRRSQRNCRKGWKNLDLYRSTNNPNAGRKKRKVVAVLDNGSFRVFPYLKPAAEWIGGSRSNIGRCCFQNESMKMLYEPWGKRFGTAKKKVPNTDHQYKGVRFYYEDSPIWLKKIKNN